MVILVIYKYSKKLLRNKNIFFNFYLFNKFYFRCATGEAWQEIMMACTMGRGCAKTHNVLLDTTGKPQTCGTNVSYAYFTSFVFLSSFLVILSF